MEHVQQIIAKRKRKPLTFLVILAAMLIFANLTGQADTPLKEQALYAGILSLPFILISAVNAMNYPTPRPYYRRINKIFYLSLGKIVIIVSIINFFSSIHRLLNPFSYFMSDKTPGGDTLSAGLSVAIGADAVSEQKPAQIVEAYFDNLEHDNISYSLHR